MTSESVIIHSGQLKLFEKRKSHHAWSELWAVLANESLRLFTNHESYLQHSVEVKLIRLTAGTTVCQSDIHKHFQFKICSCDATFMFECESESARQGWLNKLKMVISGFCRKKCFHCNEKCLVPTRMSDSESTAKSSQSCGKGVDSQIALSNQSSFTSSNANNSRRRCEDQITLNSPLKIYDTEENEFSSFERTKCQTSFQRPRSPIKFGQTMECDKKIMKNNFGYSFETDSTTDDVKNSSLKLFESQNKVSKRFSTFLKRSSLKHGQHMTEFANPNFVLEDEKYTTEFVEIPKEISKVYGEF